MICLFSFLLSSEISFNLSFILSIAPIIEYGKPIPGGTANGNANDCI